MPFALPSRLTVQACLGTLACAVLTACGGGGDVAPSLARNAEPLGEDGLPLNAEAWPLARSAALAHLSRTEVTLTPQQGSSQTVTAYLYRDPNVASRQAAVVLMHGCAGLWSNSKPADGVLSHIHQRWVAALAAEGLAVMLVDSFTPRHVANQCNSTVVKHPTDHPGTVDKVNEVSTRPLDALAARHWLVAQGHALPARVALLGWSNGATAVLSTLDSSRQASPGDRPFAEGFAYYPGCGMDSAFGGIRLSTWKPYAPLTLYHAALDPLYTATTNVGTGAAPNFQRTCDWRVARAQALGASLVQGNAVALDLSAGARHSFDQIDLSKPLAAPYTQADADAQSRTDPLVIQRLKALFPVPSF